ncbi:LTA synthase family protein [Flavihumibacter sp. R14]|nr:LTA synthase family protein [Flavihumibacter soli]
MRKVVLLLMFFLFSSGLMQAQTKIENLIIITSDGLRWQEVFKGMDTVLANKERFNQGDSSYIYDKYGAGNHLERRKRLLPFFWETLARHGQLYGNRTLGNKVNNANPHWFSYPGYSELFTGFADSAINSNNYPPNPHTTILEFLNKQAKYKDRVAAFGAWGAFDRILNEERAGFPVVSAFNPTGGNNPTEREVLLNQMLADSFRPWGSGECLDVFTHYAAMEHLKTRKPKILYIGYGETDEWAHSGQYRSYLDAARQVDKWVGDIWKFVQNDPAYKDKTALLITVDHGRGDQNKNLWVEHGQSVPGASETWFALLGPGITAKGEIRKDMQLYQEQLAQTVAGLLGLEFKAEHPVARGVVIR